MKSWHQSKHLPIKQIQQKEKAKVLGHCTEKNGPEWKSDHLVGPK